MVKQTIGKVRTNGDTGKTVIKFLLSQNTVYTNPQSSKPSLSFVRGKRGASVGRTVKHDMARGIPAVLNGQ
jgi:hypothetical protein